MRRPRVVPTAHGAFSSPFRRRELSDREALLLLRIEMEQKRPEALALARNHALFDLSDGDYWRDRAILEEEAGRIDVADHAWREAVFYAPDVNSAGALEFSKRHPAIRQP